MFFAANGTGKLYIARRVWADGDVTASNKTTDDRTEAFPFATAEEANVAAKNLFRKSAGPAIEAVSAPAKVNEPVNFRRSMKGCRPSSHQEEEASIHGDHELFT